MLRSGGDNRGAIFKEIPIASNAVEERSTARAFASHQQRLRKISHQNVRPHNVGNGWSWNKPEYLHLTQNVKGAQMRSERYGAIARENQMLLQKIALMEQHATLSKTKLAPESVRVPARGRLLSAPEHAMACPNPRRASASRPLLPRWPAMPALLSTATCRTFDFRSALSGDPTEGTWEFRPGVRLNRFQVPVIDHAISLSPKTLGVGSNRGARRRELERITRENHSLVQRIQTCLPSEHSRLDVLRRHAAQR